MKITERIKKLEDAYEYLGLKMEDEIPFANPNTGRQIAANGFIHATILVEALNEKIRPDYNDSNRVKYEILWYMKSKAAGGPGFSYNVRGYYSSASCVGARLVFLDYDVMRYAAETFAHIFEMFMTFPD